MLLRRFAHDGRPARPVHASLSVARLCCAMVVALGFGSPLFAQPEDAPSLRLRVYWSGPSAQWSGSASVSEGRLAHPQPLSGEADSTALAMLEGAEVRIAARRPLVRGAFDVTALADRSAHFQMELRHGEAAPIVVDVPLSELAQKPHIVKMDGEAGFLQIYRVPDDRLRVRSDREQFIFAPGDSFAFTVEAALPGVEPFTPVTLHAELRRGRTGDAVWAAEPQQVTFPTSGPATADFEAELPGEEGVYTVHLAAHPRSGMLAEWVKGSSKPLAERTFQIVVWDGDRVTRATDSERLLHEIDPATPRWWERIPGWRWPRRMWRSEGPLGSAAAEVTETPIGRFVRLGARRGEAPAAWQAYPLSVQNAGAPHVVEIDVPASAPQALNVALLDSDALGRASSLGDGLTAAVEQWTSDEATRTVRKLFWPRSTSPLLVISNHSTKHDALYGKVRVYELQRAESPRADAIADERLMAACVSSPYLPRVLHASRSRAHEAEYLYEDWQTFYESATRLADYVELAGYNGAVVKVAGAPGAVYPSKVLGAQPGLDWGVFASGVRDVPRKDLLELLLREFDRRGLRFVPAVAMESMLPGVEARRDGAEGPVDCVDTAGRTHPGAPAPYNPLSQVVHDQMVAVVAELTARCEGHPSFAGVALDLTPRGYGTFPGDAWGADPATVQRFFHESGLRWPDDDTPRDAAHVESALVGPLLARWRAWRGVQVAALYGEMARLVQANNPEARFLLLADRLLDDEQGRAALRPDLQKKPSLERTLAARGVNTTRLAMPPGLTFVWPREVSPPAELPAAAAPLAKNELFWADAPAPDAVLLSSSRASVTLPALAARSPFGAEQTDPSFVVAKRLTAGAAARDLTWAVSAAPRADVLDGGDAAPLMLDAARARALRVLRRIPSDATHSSAQSHQPLAVHSFQSEDASYAVVANQSAWPISTTVTLNTPVACESERLAPPSQAPATPSRLDPGTHAETLQLEAYGVAAFRFDQPGVTVSGVRSKPQSEAVAALGAAVEDLQNRDLGAPALVEGPGNLSFEDRAPDGLPVGWEARADAGVALTDKAPAHGSAALSISAGAAPVGVTSRPFAAPRTGQFVMTLHVRGDRIGPQSELTIRVRDEEGAFDHRRVVNSNALDKPDQWQWFLLSEELPLEEGLRLTVSIEATSACVSIDHVQMHALDFPLDYFDGPSKRLALVPFAPSAEQALHERNITDCQQILEGYWPRFLKEFTPLVEPQPHTATADKGTPTKEKKEKPRSLSSRLRSYLPDIPWF